MTLRRQPPFSGGSSQRCQWLPQTFLFRTSRIKDDFGSQRMSITPADPSNTIHFLVIFRLGRQE